jgi:hypothetical protein
MIVNEGARISLSTAQKRFHVPCSGQKDLLGYCKSLQTEFGIIQITSKRGKEELGIVQHLWRSREFSYAPNQKSQAEFLVVLDCKYLQAP